MTGRYHENWTVFVMCLVTSFLSTGECLWYTQWQVSGELNSIYVALSDKFLENCTVFMMHSVTRLLRTGQCLCCTQWQDFENCTVFMMHSVTRFWELDSVYVALRFLRTEQCLWYTQWQVCWELDSVYVALSDKFPEHWTVVISADIDAWVAEISYMKAFRQIFSELPFIYLCVFQYV
jgi:hypothetical protein